MREDTLRKRWGRIPDEFDRYLKKRWDSIKRRTEDPTDANYNRYGGRGIRLSDEFQDPRVFVAYVKSLPNASEDLELDRTDNGKGYERGNLRWVTRKENCNNRDITFRVNFKGREMPLADFVREHTDISYNYVAKLLKDGKRPEEIVKISRDSVPSEFRGKGRNRNTNIVEFRGKKMSLMGFAHMFVPNMSYQNVLSLYHEGRTLEEISGWEKRHHRTVSYNGEDMTFPEFVRRYLKMSLPYANRLYYTNGVSLDGLVNWRLKTDVVSYKGEEMHFKDFVANHAEMAYSTARQWYRNGKSLDEIARWGKKGLGI